MGTLLKALFDHIWLILFLLLLLFFFALWLFLIILRLAHWTRMPVHAFIFPRMMFLYPLQSRISHIDFIAGLREQNDLLAILLIVSACRSSICSCIYLFVWKIADTSHMGKSSIIICVWGSLNFDICANPIHHEFQSHQTLLFYWN